MKKLNPFRQPVTFREYALGKWRKVTLKPGQRVHFSQFRYTDEGWRREDVVFRRAEDGGTVTATWMSDGRDCDGRLSTYTQAECPLCDLKVRRVWQRYIRRNRNEWRAKTSKAPQWIMVERSQRDYAAEAAGY